MLIYEKRENKNSIEKKIRTENGNTTQPINSVHFALHNNTCLCRRRQQQRITKKQRKGKKRFLHSPLNE